MKLLISYALARLKVNRGQHLFIFMTVILASVIICAFTLLYLAQYHIMLDMAVSFSGSHHFVIDDNIPDDKLSYITENLAVKTAEKRNGHVFVTLHDPGEAYTVSENIARALGMELNGYGRYNITYNRQYLGILGIKDPYTMKRTALGDMLALSVPTVVLIMLLFIIIIYGAFTAAEKKQVKELGILKSIGAAPEQIKLLILLEALIYCLPAIPPGLIIGYTVQAVLSRFVFSWQIVLLCILSVVITVISAAYIPAVRMSKLIIINALTGAGSASAEKSRLLQKYTPIKKPSAITGLLAHSSFIFHLRAFRASLITLSLFMIIMLSFCSFITIWRTDYKIQLDNNDFNIRISGYNRLNNDLAEKISLLSPHYVSYDFDIFSMSLDNSGYSFDFDISSGIWDQGGKTVLHGIIYGFDNLSFNNYCNSAGINAAELDTGSVIIVDDMRGTLPQYHDHPSLGASLPFKIGKGDVLTLEAKSPYDMTNSICTAVKIGAFSQIYPALDTVFFPYDVVLVAAADTFYNVITELRGDSYPRQVITMLNIPYEDITKKSDEIAGILSGDGADPEWNITTRIDSEREFNENSKSIIAFFMSLILFFGVAGVTGTVVAISGNLDLRTRDFMLLRSQGMTPEGLEKMLLYEIRYFTLIPPVVSFPAAIIFTAVVLPLFNNATLGAVILNLPYIKMLLCIAAVNACIIITYLVQMQRIVKTDIAANLN